MAKIEKRQTPESHTWTLNMDAVHPDYEWEWGAAIRIVHRLNTQVGWIQYRVYQEPNPLYSYPFEDARPYDG